MNIHFKCSECGKHLEIGEKGAGMSVACPDCMATLAIPAATSSHTCPQCNVSILVDDNLKGATFECSTCRQLIHIPSPGDTFEHKCPLCHVVIPIPVRLKGFFTDCPNCGQHFHVPGSSQRCQYYTEPPPSPVQHGPANADDSAPASDSTEARTIIKAICGALCVFGFIVGLYGLDHSSKGITLLGLSLWLPAVMYLCATNRMIRFVVLSAIAVIANTAYAMKFYSYSWPGLIISIIVAVIITIILPVWRSPKESPHFLLVTGNPLKEIAYGLVVIFILTILHSDSRQWLFSLFTRERQQSVKATASSGQGDEWVSGVPKASESTQQASQKSRNAGKKFTGLDGQDTLGYIELNNGTVIYSNPITENEASALAKFLVPVVFDGTKTAVVLAYSDGNYIMGKKASVEETNINGFHKAYSLLAREVSAQVFNGRPVTICFFDKDLNILTEISNSEGEKEFKEYQNTLAYQRGFEHGKRMGEQDRDLGNYRHQWKDSPDNTVFDQVAHLAGCDPGTPEYEDFAEGYDLGYRAGR